MNPLDGIRQVQIELSNQCPLAYQHPKCPAHWVKEPKTLPSKIVWEVLRTLEYADYDGEVMFSIYNEPLTDPRLTDFLEGLKLGAPHASAYIITNGYGLDQNLLDALVEAGAQRVLANGYTEKEAERLSAFKAKCKYRVRHDTLDDRMEMYDREPLDLDWPCRAPLRNLAIWHTGEVGLCCRDWKRSGVFGNLHTQSLEAILSGPTRQRAITLLGEGNRRATYEVCRRCDRRWRR